ncbi:MAG TPA: hypothetical protein VGG77_14420 [Roseiarcus sp.]|jgi:hypothetical protein
MTDIAVANGDHVLERVRLIGAEQKTTINTKAPEFSAKIADQDERKERTRDRLRELMRNSKGRRRPDFKFDREETNER